MYIYIYIENINRIYKFLKHIYITCLSFMKKIMFKEREVFKSYIKELSQTSYVNKCHFSAVLIIFIHKYNLFIKDFFPEILQVYL